MRTSKGDAIEITRLRDGKKMYTGVRSINHNHAEKTEGYECKYIKYEGCCIYANINDRAHDRFPIEIDGRNVKEFLDEIATESECYSFFD